MKKRKIEGEKRVRTWCERGENGKKKEEAVSTGPKERKLTT